MLIVGDKTDAMKVVQLLQKVGIKKSYLGFVCNKKEDEKETPGSYKIIVDSQLMVYNI